VSAVTAWRRALVEELIAGLLFGDLLVSYGITGNIIIFTRACSWSIAY